MTDRIEKISPYFIEMQVINVENDKAIYVNVRFKPNWLIPDTELENYEVDYLEKDDGTYVFYTSFSNGDKKLFDCIDYIIKLNLDAEEREKIFRLKVNELKEIFTDENNILVFSLQG